MNIRIWSGTCAATVFGLAAVLAGAQDAPQTRQNSAGKSITVTGCIQRAEQATTGTSGRSAANRGTSETKFLLTNAAMSTSGTTGTAGTTSRSTAALSEYRLDADDAKLTPHVGHKVEITGTTEQPPSTTQPPAASAANAPKLKVDNVKMIASTCP
ncbi:MAG: hypothetical protein DMG04_07295 [Acidobacteria bacterium]|nr:MAG: hypothetical protein DMG04_07295 [Acidobacteriota bacterium]